MHLDRPREDLLAVIVVAAESFNLSNFVPNRSSFCLHLAGTSSSSTTSPPISTVPCLVFPDFSKDASTVLMSRSPPSSMLHTTAVLTISTTMESWLTTSSLSSVLGINGFYSGWWKSSLSIIIIQLSTKCRTFDSSVSMINSWTVQVIFSTRSLYSSDSKVLMNSMYLYNQNVKSKNSNVSQTTGIPIQ